MSEDRQERFGAYVEALAEVIGHADRAEPLRDYCRGLLLPGERKSVEPIAAVTAPARVSAKHQSLLHFVANAPWSNERVALIGFWGDGGTSQDQSRDESAKESFALGVGRNPVPTTLMVWTPPDGIDVPRWWC